MVTPADFAAFQQQLRQEVTDVLQQLRAKVNDAISGRMDTLNSIHTALQNVSVGKAIQSFPRSIVAQSGWMEYEESQPPDSRQAPA